jgi:hypothetical protein
MKPLAALCIMIASSVTDPRVALAAIIVAGLAVLVVVLRPARPAATPPLLATYQTRDPFQLDETG